MIRHKWSIKVRNTLSSLAMECDSCAAIEGAKMTKSEREELKKMLMKAVTWMDKKFGLIK